MKKHHLVRLACLILSIFFLLPTAAATNGIQPRYQEISALTSELHGISLAGRATCCGTVSLWLNSNCTVDLIVELQQSEDGVNNWSTIKSWSNSGDQFVAVEEYWYVDSGYYYRAATCAIVYDTDGNYIESDALSSAVFYY